MDFEKLIKKYEERRAALVTQSDKSTDVAELRSLQKQIQDLTADINELRAAIPKKEEIDERTAAVNGEIDVVVKKRGEPPKFVPGKGFTPAENRNVEYDKAIETRDKAGSDLKENRAVNSPFGIFGELRAVTVGSGSIVVPNYSADTINPTFESVSSLIDGVNHLEFNGGESFKMGYEVGFATGSYTAEGSDAATADTTFDYVEINKSKITAYTEVTEELQKLPNANYADVVFQNVRNSMRKLITKEILIGDGSTNHLAGIFSTAANAIDSDTDIAFSTIDDKTLDNIIFSYGGDEAIEGAAVLILSKKDLAEFAKVRTANTLRYYDIKTNGNSGTINSIPFVINSACNAVSDANTATGAYCMAYGHLSNYSLITFSPMEVKSSTDFKFKAGMTAYRGVVFCGGNVTRRNGFCRIRKG